MKKMLLILSLLTVTHFLFPLIIIDICVANGDFVGEVLVTSLLFVSATTFVVNFLTVPVHAALM